jgi:short-subunit dehydrogenase
MADLPGAIGKAAAVTIAKAAELPVQTVRGIDKRLRPGHALASVISEKRVLITGASSGIGRAAAVKVADAGGIPLLVARRIDKLNETKREIEDLGGTAYVYPADLSDMDVVDRLADEILDAHPAVDVLVNNAGRSIRRSLALSYDRFHDYERTMQLNYFAAVKLILRLLPSMRQQRSGQVINISSIGAQTYPPRFSAYVASKAALEGFTRVAASECIGENVHFTTVHMPLVRTPMIAPTKMYESFPAITPDEAANLILVAIRDQPKHINTALGTLGELSYALAPKAVDQVLHQAYRTFPDSAASQGVTDPAEAATPAQVRFARLLRGVHW